ncbi:MAG: Glu-tRNA(Gln) amidotransferase subunit GatD [Candidatus Bathyarchaeia archaeon]
MDFELTGYRGDALKVLKEAHASIGDYIRAIVNGNIYEGILIPRTEYADDKHILIKLKSGYNVGLKISPSIKIEVIKHEAKPAFIPPKPPKGKEGLPKIMLISTGGTIASKVDYRTGAVEPALTASDLYGVIPELSEIANIETEILFSEFSENLTPQHWKKLATTIANMLEDDLAGIVVAHGTDTMGYTAAALSFAIQNSPIPIVLVGSQRSSDRPSSDAASNLIGAVLVASKAPFAEVVVVMHEGLSDELLAVHRGTKVRKCHTSRRDAFKSINVNPLAHVILDENKIELLSQEFKPRDSSKKPIIKPDFHEKVTLLKFYPGMNSKIIDWFVEQNYKGIILEGTGLGHVGRYLFNSLKKAIDSGVFIGMTSQCIWGSVNMNVYNTGRDLQAIGVVPLGDMLPETSLVKLMWALAQSKDLNEVRQIMLSDIAGEFSLRRF